MMGRFLIIPLLVSLSVIAEANPSGVNISGKITLQSDNSALSGNDVDFKIRVLSTDGCVLYTEKFLNQDLSTTSGVFNITIGNGVATYNAWDAVPATANSKASLLKVFSNGSVPIASGLTAYPGETCAGGAYTPTDGDVRRVVIEFDPTGTDTPASYVALSPYHSIRSVPYAMLADHAADADKLGGVPAAQYAKTADLATAVPASETDPNVEAFAKTPVTNLVGGACDAGYVLTYNGTALTCVADGGGGGYTLPIASDTVLGGVRVQAGSNLTINAGNGDLAVDPALITTIDGKVNASAIEVCPANQVPVWVSITDSFDCMNISITASQVSDFNTAVDARVAAGSFLPLAGGTLTGDLTMSGAGTDINVGNNIVANIGYLHMENKAADPGGATNGYIWYNATDKLLKYYDGTANRAIPGYTGACADQEILKWDNGAGTWICASDSTGGTPGDATYAAKGLVQFDTSAATSGITVSSGVASVNSGTAGGAGDANKIPKLDGSGLLATGMIPGLDWAKITSGTPTTLGGYGITDAVQNAGGTPSVQSGDTASRPAFGTAGRIYIDTDTNTIYRDTGAAWVAVGDGAGTGTVTAVSSANGDITITNPNTTPELTLNTGTGNNQIVKLDGTAKLPAVDGSQLTNITTTIDKITSAAGLYFNYRPNDVACSDGQVLKWDNGNTRWICGADAGAGGADASSIRGVSVNLSAGTPSDGAFLTYNSANTSWEAAVFLNCVAANKVLHYNSTLDVWSCDDIQVNSAEIVDGTIVNDDINASAAIARTKLANGTANRVLVNDGSGVMTDAAAITADRAVVSDANGIPTHSAVTGTELGYLSGVTSAIQTQIDNLSTGAADKVAKAGDTMTGNLVMNAQSEVRYADSDSSNYVAIRSPSTVATDVTLTLPADAGTADYVLKTDGTGVLSWVAQTASPGDAGYSPGNKGVVAFDTSAATSGITVSSGVASVNSGTAGGAGDANKIPKLDGSGLLATGMIPGLDWAKITSGTPTTLGGYGITDAVQNAGGTPSVQTGDTASRPAFGTAGRIYIDTDTNTIYRDTGAAWVAVGDGAGTGTVTAVSSANGDITVTNPNTTPELTLNTGTGNNQIVKLDGTAKLPAVDGSQLTNITTTIDKITSAAGLYFNYRPNDVACSDGQVLKWDNGNTRWICGADAGAGGADASSIRGVSVNLSAGTPSDGAFLTYNSANTSWEAAVFLNCVAANKVLHYNSTLDVWSCDDIQVNSAEIVDGTIVDADINASAAIARTKLANGTANRVLVNDGSGVMADAAAITADRALISDANGIPTHSAVTNTELGYLSGVTSAIQTQIDNLSTGAADKVAKAGDAMTGALTMNAENEVRFADTDSSNYIGFKAPGTVGANRIWTLPAGDGTANQVLQTDGSGVLSWTSQTAAPGDASYAAKGVVQFDTSAATSGITVSSGVASVNSGTAGGAGDANKIPKLDGSGLLATGMIPGLDWAKITSGTPTTLGGYGITDAVQNAGGTPSVQTGDTASRPAFGTAGRIYIDTDTNTIYRDTGAAWVAVGDGAGTGTVTAVSSANGDITITNPNTTPELTLNTGTGNNQIVKLDGSAKLPAVDGSALTNIDVASISSGGASSGKFFSYKPDGNECADGEILKWVAATDRWICGTAADLGAITSVVAGTGIDVNTAAGAATVSVEAELGALNALATTGYVQRTGAATYSTTAGNTLNSNNTVVTRDGSGVSGFAGVILNNAGMNVTQVAPAAGTSYQITWPDNDGNANQVLQTDGAGVLTWASVLTTVDSAAITDGSIVDADINASAAIARTKLANGTANRIVVNDGSGVMSDAAAITADRALISDANGIPTHSAVTGTELGYLSGVTSSVQTQLTGKVSKTGDAMTGALTMEAANEVRFADTDSSNYVGFKSPGVVGANKIWTLPAADGGAGQALKTDGAGNLDWVTLPAGAVDSAYDTKGIVGFDTSAATSGMVYTTSGIAKVNTGTGADQIVKLDGSAKLPAVDGSALTNLDVQNIASAAGKYFKYMPNGAECADGGILKWVAASDQWVCGTMADAGAITSVVAGNGIDVNTAAGAATVSVEAELNALNGLATTGFVQRTGAATYSTVAGNTANSNSTVVTRDGSGVSGFAGVVLNNAAMNVTQQAPAAGTSYSVTWPAAAPTSDGQILSSTTGGVMSWIDAATGTGDFKADGTVAMTGALRNIAGTAALPGMTFVGDTNTGISAATADTMVLSTSGTQRMIFDPNGNVGIGTVAPTALFDVQGGTASGSTKGKDIKIVAQTGGSGGAAGGDIYITPGDGGGGWQPGKVFINTSGSANTALQVTRAGTDAYATSSGASNGPNTNTLLHNSWNVDDNTALLGFSVNNGSSRNQTAYIGALATTGAGSYNSVMVFGQSTGASSYSESMRLDTSGNLGIGTSSPGAKLDVKGAIRMSGATSGYTGFQPAAAAGSTVWTLPTGDGSPGEVLSTNGSGILSWVAAGTTPGDAGYGSGNKGIVAFNTDATTSGISVASGVATVNMTQTAEASKILQLDSSSRAVTKGMIMNDGDTNTISLLPNSNITTNYSLTFPAAAPGSNGMVLASQTDGTLSWITPLTGSIASSQITDGTIVDADISASADIARSKLADGTANHVLINDAGGVMSSEANLAVSRGGTGVGSLTANSIMMVNGTGTGVTSPSCTAGQTLIYTGSVWTCSTDFVAALVGSAVNYVVLTGSTGTSTVKVTAGGTGTNLDMTISGKGTGNVVLGEGSNTYVQTEKTLNVNATYIERAPAAATTTGAVTIPVTSNIYRHTLTNATSTTFTLPACPAATNTAFSLTVKVTQSGAGTGTLGTWAVASGTLEWDSNTEPTMTTTANKDAIYQFLCIGGEAKWYGMQVWKYQ